MKRYIRSAVQPAKTSGTTFYQISLDDLLDHFSQDGENIWMWKSFEELGWKALNFHKHLYNSFFYENSLYLCVTDGSKVKYQGEKVDVEDLPTSIDIDELKDCIADGNDQIIHRYITPYEIKTPKFSKWSKDLEDMGYEKEKLRKDAKQFNVSI